MNKCRTCQFYIAEDAEDYGHCHRFPPPPDWGSFPKVVEEDWCGEQRQLAFPRDESASSS